MNTLRSRQNEAWLKAHSAQRLQLPTLDSERISDVAVQARAIIVRCHPLYPSLWRAVVADDAVDIPGTWGARLRRREEAVRKTQVRGEFHYSYWRHSCGKSSTDRDSFRRPSYRRVARIIARMLPDIEVNWPWPSQGDLIATIRLVAKYDLFAEVDLRQPVRDTGLATQAEAALTWAYTQPPSKREVDAIARVNRDRQVQYA